MNLSVKYLGLVLGSLLFVSGCQERVPKAGQSGSPDFKGKIALDIRDSESDWSAFLPKQAPADAPNILFILYDDTGLASWSPYGGRIHMPTLDRLAENGLTYTQWHTTALCSPTRSTILTGRNHHLNGMAAITEAADGFLGANGRVPDDCAPFAEILRENGWNTFWIGKDHNVPEQDVAPGGSRSEWPTSIGFDRFYGFLGGETNNWYPDLV
jgi:arylsulfatase A-like enzyme